MSILSFENKLNSLNSDAKERQIEMIKKEIEEHIEQIEKILFDNKSLYFKNGYKSTYLIVIDDAFLNKEDFFDLKKNHEVGNHLLFKSKLLVTKKTNVTTLKIKDLKKLTIDKFFSKQIILTRLKENLFDGFACLEELILSSTNITLMHSKC